MLLVPAGLYLAHRQIYAVPRARLAPGAFYAGLPEDATRHYIDLPLDHRDPSKGTFRGYYLLGPGFDARKPVVFFLTDGQMELVGPRADFGFFDEVVGGASYVLIGVRGQSPGQFPEVFAGGDVDYEAATNLYGSDQQIEDIELVRLDLVRKGILAPDGRIEVFGASGAGVLAQQYVSKYGRSVSRLLLESTGAPDLSRGAGETYSPAFRDFNPQAAAVLEELVAAGAVDKRRASNVLFQTGRKSPSPREAQVRILEEIRDGRGLWRDELDPAMNLAVLGYLVKSPDGLAARVRWFELVGHDLMKYDAGSPTNLLYEVSATALSDFVEHYRARGLAPKTFEIERASFAGEVLILKGTQDVVFADSVSRAIAAAYPNSRLIFIPDGHRMQKDKEGYRRIRTAFLNDGLASPVLQDIR